MSTFKFRRCIASLCLAVLLVGLIPTSVHAEYVYYPDDGYSFNITSSDPHILTYHDKNMYTFSTYNRTDFDETIAYEALNYWYQVITNDTSAVTHDDIKSKFSTGSATPDDIPKYIVYSLAVLYEAESDSTLWETSSDMDISTIMQTDDYLLVEKACEDFPAMYDYWTYIMKNHIATYIDNNPSDPSDDQYRDSVAADMFFYSYAYLATLPAKIDSCYTDTGCTNIDTNKMSELEGYLTLISNAWTYFYGCDLIQEDRFNKYRLEFINALYTTNYTMLGDKSIKDLKEEFEQHTGQTLDPTTSVTVGEYTSDYDNYNNPLSRFYTINRTSILSIPFTSIDRDSIVDDVTVDNTMDRMLAVARDKWQFYKKEEDPQTYLSKELVAYYDQLGINPNNQNTSVAEAISTYQSFLSVGSESNILTSNGIKNGIAVSAQAATISDFVVQGITYSTTYIPLHTNLYAPNTIASFSEDYREEFYYRYGFYRKALMIDTSASAAVDYYTSRGVYTPTTRVCTLRDLIEANDRDIVLFIDSKCYNAEAVKQVGQQYIDTQNAQLEGLKQAVSDFNTLDNYYGTGSVVNFLEYIWNHALWNSKDPDEEQFKTQKAQWEDSGREEMRRQIIDTYGFDVDAANVVVTSNDGEYLGEYYKIITKYLDKGIHTQVDDAFLKTNDAKSYSSVVRNDISSVVNAEYKDLYSLDKIQAMSQGLPSILRDPLLTAASHVSNTAFRTQDNTDAVVMRSFDIGQYMAHDSVSKKTTQTDEDTQNISFVTSLEAYNPLQPFAFISYLYRDIDAMTTAELVGGTQPVFMASDDLCGISDANQWYRNSLLNYALIRNLEGVAQIDYNYVIDLDSPLYMDICGNILTESGLVVIPAASNMTLHTGAMKFSNIAVGLYAVYGKTYSVPLDTPGAYSVLAPYFTADLMNDVYIINPIKLTMNGESVQMNHVNQYSKETLDVVQGVYKQAVCEDGCTNYNWPALCNIVNEVLRGAPIEEIDKDAENIVTATGPSKSTIIAAIKLEGLIDSLEGRMSNTLMSIPDFTRNDNTEYWVALLIKIMLVVTTGVVIVAIYRDGVSGQLGFHTFITCLSSVVLTFLCIVIIPAVFQLTYYGANKSLLEKEAFTILMVNTEKQAMGVDIAMTGTREPTCTDDFSLQLDWISVPWYKQINEMMFGSGLDTLQKTKLDAYKKSPTYYQKDVEIYNDGVYITASRLFESATIDMTESGNTTGLYIHTTENEDMTASFYSPYYVFLRVLCANVNEYNKGREYVDASVASEEDYTYTTKYTAGNVLKTVGLSEAYFTSTDFMDKDTDIMRLYQIYGGLPDDPDYDQVRDRYTTLDHYYNRALLFDEEDIKSMRSSIWYNPMGVVSNLDKRVEIIDGFARDFVANNKDLLNRVSDETFIKVMALYMAVKYNQTFGITHANALEIYNLDSTDLLRLCIAPVDKATLMSPMSYSRYVCTFGGEASVYAAAVLTAIMYVGSFVKPLCTVLVYMSVFMSIFIFKVVLKRPSANLWGYFVTCMLLCATNYMHAVILKISVNLPSTGLSMLGCIIFMIVGQVVYLLFLAYVTGVACKDWSNLGATEYAKEAAHLKGMFGRNAANAATDNLNGRVQHHDDNWDYYNDLVVQHRARNRT